MTKTEEIFSIIPDNIQLEIEQTSIILRYLDNLAVATETMNKEIVNLNNDLIEARHQYEVLRLAKEKLATDGADKEVIQETKKMIVEAKHRVLQATGNHSCALRASSTMNQNRINAVIALKALRP